MQISSVHVKNFRSIKNEALRCESLTALVGANGSGKSSFLKALELFYAPAPKFSEEDFYDRDVSEPIEIEVTYSNLSPAAAKKFDAYLSGGNLTVARVLSWDGKPADKYHGVRPQHPAFATIRSLDKASEKKAAYEKLRKDPQYKELPSWSNKEAVSSAMATWEGSNPLLCKPARDDGQFFGFKEVASGYLGEFSRLIFVPAVKDAGAEADDSKGSAIMELMDLVVRNAILSKPEVQTFQTEIQDRYDKLIDPTAMPEMGNLQDDLSKTLQTYVPQVSLAMDWVKARTIDIPLPRADVKVLEDGFALTVGRTGHGLQRAFILTLLQHLALAQTSSKQGDDKTRAARAIVLAIEEPELYQHPSRQRHLARTLLDLAGGSIPGVAESTQVLYCTHSPLMVGLDRFEQVRLLRKTDAGKKPKTTRVVSATFDAVAEKLWEATDRTQERFTGDTLRSRLHSLMTPWMNEGFFADVVLLVEGEDDRAALLAVAKARGIDLETEGYAVIPCSGKTNLDRPQVIFSMLGIPTYTLWDGDRFEKNDGKPGTNRLLMRIHGMVAEDWPCFVGETSACFDDKLEAALKADLGEDEFATWLRESMDEHGIFKQKHGVKNPLVLTSVLTRAKAAGKTADTLERILDKILAIKDSYTQKEKQ